MKKLFSSMLAATMVAGMAVTAFASTSSTMDRTNFGNNDFGLIGAYDADGNKKNPSNSRLDSGDKLYYPILISNEELEVDNISTNDSDMLFATKASEIDDLKASVKDEIGGKYIEDASIVKKNISITDAGDTEYKDTFANHPAVTASDIETKLGAGYTVTGSTNLTGGVDNVDAAPVAGLVAKREVAVANVTVEYVEGTGNDAPGSVAATYKPSSDTVEIVVTGTTDSAGVKGDFTASASAIQTELGAGYTVTGDSLKGGASAVSAAPASLTVKREVAVANGVSVEYKKAKSGEESTGNVTAKYNSSADKVEVVITGVNTNGASGNALNQKVYCVEVKLSDYFKNEETEVEFNIKLKNNGRTEFDSDDDAVSGNGAFFNGTFDLGKDSEIFDLSGNGKANGAKATKFKKGELEIEIGEKTTSLQLDEAITSGGDKEDVDKIFIESDDTIDNAFTFEVKASGQDDLFLELNQDAVKDLAVSNQKADLTFFNFPGTPEFDFSGTATFAVEDEDEDNYFYEIVDGELVDTRAKYDEDDGVFKLRTNKLGSYVISDRELDTVDEEDVNDEEDKVEEETGGNAGDATTNNDGSKPNANTGAADLIGVASALAVVSVAAAGAVALKK